MNSDISTESVDDILNILNESSSKMILSQRKEIVLVIGDTGSGKSTLVHFIGKKNETLKSVEESAGQYLLIDEDGKISKNTTISQTTSPELVEDINTETTFYDCPGFNDTRDPATDIANAFLIHKILNHGTAFKIIVVINYHSVRTGVDRKAFIELLKNISDMIKDVNKYRSSIIGVVTKVDNATFKQGGNYILLTDFKILDSIASFLQKVKLEIPQDRSYYKNAIDLIDIFLSQNQDNYERLALFRRPDEVGPVNEIDILKNEKIQINNIIREKINFTKRNINDFGYAISTDSQNMILCLVVKINENIVATMKEISDNILCIYKTRESNISDLNEQINEFTEVQKHLLQFTNNMTDCMTVVDCISYITTLLNNIKLEVPQSLLTNLSNYNEQLQFIDQLTENDLNIKSSHWIHGFNDLTVYVNESKDWYICLEEIFTQLSKYMTQKKNDNFNINKLNLIETGADFANILEEIFNYENGIEQVSSYLDRIKNQANGLKLRMLRAILIYTLEPDLNFITTDDTKVQIRGKYVRISNIRSNILFSTKNYIEIFACNSVFIDEDLNFEGLKQKIVIAAPEWHIINTRKINLNGSNGVEFSETKAKNGKLQGEKGQHGKPGLPGGAAGTLIGLGEIFTNLESLTITADGGKGGDGQNGGNGANGLRGKNPVLPKGFLQKVSPFVQMASTGFRFKNLSHLESTKLLDQAFSAKDAYYFEMYGTDGKPGSDGGDGGYYGQGGASGKINVLDLKNEPKQLNYNSVDGKNGKEGIGGCGGLGGRNGQRVLAKYIYRHSPNSVSALAVPVVGYWLLPAIVDNFTGALWKIHKEYSRGNQATGMNGTTNNNKNGYKYRENSVQIENIPMIIAEYQIYLEENLHNSIKKNKISQFIQKLDITGIYSKLK